MFGARLSIFGGIPARRSSVHDLKKVDASPIHLANGVWGLIAAGLFATQEGYSASYYEERAHR